MHENLVARELQLLVDAIHEAIVDIPRCDVILQSTGSLEATLVALDDLTARRSLASELAAYARRLSDEVVHGLIRASRDRPDRIHPLHQSMTGNELATIGLILLRKGLLDEAELRGP
jgi:hypothetical protein